MTFMRRGVFYTFMIYYLYDLLGKVTIVAMLGTFTMVASSLGQNFLWGRIADRYKLRTQLIVVGEITAGIAYILVFLLHKSLIDAGSDTVAGMVIITGLSILEFFWSMSDVGWAALVTDITTPEIRGRFIGTINFISSVGRMTGVVTAGFLYLGGLGFRQGTIFYVVTAMLFAGAAIMWLASRSLKSKIKQYAKGGSEIGGNGLVETHESEVNAKSDNPRVFAWFLVALAIIVLGATSINQVFLLFLKLPLPDGLNATDEQVSLVVTAWTLGGMTASVLSGRLADKIGRVKVISLGLLLAMATLLSYGIVPNVALMALTYGINGVSFMTLQTAGFALAGDIIPAHRRGRLLSRYNAVMALSWGPAGLLIGGPLADIQTGVIGVSRHVAYINTFIASSILIIIGAIVFLAKVREPT
jgi:MFS family permease